MLKDEDFILVPVDNNRAVRLVHKDTGIGFGSYFQAMTRSPEWKAASIVYQKYKAKFNLEYKDFLELRNYIERFSESRKLQGKKASNDFLTQECSAELKRRFAS